MANPKFGYFYKRRNKRKVIQEIDLKQKILATICLSHFQGISIFAPSSTRKAIVLFAGDVQLKKIRRRSNLRSTIIAPPHLQINPFYSSIVGLFSEPPSHSYQGYNSTQEEQGRGSESRKCEYHLVLGSIHKATSSLFFFAPWGLFLLMVFLLDFEIAIKFLNFDRITLACMRMGGLLALSRRCFLLCCPKFCASPQ